MSDIEQAPPGVDVTVPSPARMYDYILGGSANYAVDREAVKKVRAHMPDLNDAAWANRGFLQRSVRWLAEQGIRQFIDIGAGLPTGNNTHDAVHAVAPDARILYVDNDPLVEIHAKALLEGVAGTACITADFRAPDGLLGHEVTRAMIDFTQPVALLLVTVTHFVSDEDDPWGLVRRYVGGLVPGSYVALSAITSDRQVSEELGEVTAVYARSSSGGGYPRPRAEIERLLTGLEIVPPYEGAPAELCYIGEWGAEDPVAADSDGSRLGYAAVAKKTA
ncbi:SAM-dependent methyltransferase [Actinomadura sp. BRA 177]|uniref:SAM-dependent methyltransferase n=1 Tax=Actinomadura sp. BRA 177 TaxID=2745202 RepID=UPI001595F1BA|nr:SAM-dependent methyltransferase [Actinomadura sp. BRA 177]NVI88459.1 SAM-dependent methyltransferase [Actinomadura sp. BRA 177]